MRASEIKRKTAETDITLALEIDGDGKSSLRTGSGMLDHMLTLFARHGLFDLRVECDGDVEVDLHHSVEDIGICLGRAFREASGDRAGIRRYGSLALPMDEVLFLAAVDFSGRSYFYTDAVFTSEKIGEFDTELVRECFVAFAREAGITLHLRMLAGGNSHHVAECMFKATARALREALESDPRSSGIPSTKGTL